MIFTILSLVIKVMPSESRMSVGVVSGSGSSVGTP